MSRIQFALSAADHGQNSAGGTIAGFVVLVILVALIVLMIKHRDQLGRWTNQNRRGIGTFLLVLLSILTIGYFVPTLVGYVRQSHQMGIVFVVNFFLGFTLIGWVVALVLALHRRPAWQASPPPYNPYVGQQGGGPPPRPPGY